MNTPSTRKPVVLGTLLLASLFGHSLVEAATINQTLCVRNRTLTLSGQNVTFWGFTTSCGGMGSGVVPGPVIEVGVYPDGSGMSDTLNLTLNMMMAPQENAPYNGHTIHMHGADVPTSEDGVPETYNDVNGDTYTWTPTGEMEGSYAYHCHVHTVKHLEMGMYGTLIARPRSVSGTWLNQLTHNTATTYDYIQNYLLSTVDPAYHTATGDSTVFADYNPAYFLIEGKEGKTTSSPAVSLTASKNKKVALRLIGMHSTNASFSIKDADGNAKSFTVYVQDGRELAMPEIVTSVDISPGQRYDIIFTTPSTGGSWYPQVTYKKLRDNSSYATVYGRISF